MGKEIIDKIKSKCKKYIIMAIIFFILLILFGNAFEKSQYLKQLDYNVTINEDGSIRIVETWDVFISYTNTLFRNFRQSTQYGDIVDVSVVDLKANKNLTNTYEEQYHVPTDCFYALEIAGNKFEIAWGTGMENWIGNKKYQISYTITDVINDYNDCQELYWKLLSEDNTIPAKLVTGTITLPKKLSSIENLKVWGHGPLNGEIARVSEDTVKFKLKDLNLSNMLEVRLLTTERVANVKNEDRIHNYNYIDTIMMREDQWAIEANQQGEAAKTGILIFLIIYLIILVYNIVRLIQYYIIWKKRKKAVRIEKLTYYRDIPRGKDSTPGEASYLHYFDKSNFNTKKYQSNMVAGTILNLCLNKHISLRVQDKDVYVKIKTYGENLKKDELAIFELLKKCQENEEEFEIGELKKYAKENFYEYEKAINDFVNSARNSLYELQLVDKNEEKQYKKARNADSSYAMLEFLLESGIILSLLGFIPIIQSIYTKIFGVSFHKGLIETILIFIPLIVVNLIKLNILSKIKGKFAVITKDGMQEKEQWKGLINYMNHFSKLNEKEVPDLILWEQYLVYATTFGISEKLIKQMKAKYPEVFVEEYWGEHPEYEENCEIIRILTHDFSIRTNTELFIGKISNTTQSAYNTSQRAIASRTASSSGGSGGGFSSGGRRRWPVAAEWAADNNIKAKQIRKIFV